MPLQGTHMKTEAKRALSSGFALPEAELRRIHDLFVQQIRRTPDSENFVSTYEIKYQNGAVGYPANLDEVLAQENFGSKSIIRLRVGVMDRAEKPSNRVEIELANARAEEGSLKESIKYLVSGDDRDWVFVTSSQLEERIGKIKRFSPGQLQKYQNLIGVLLMLVFLIAFFSYLGKGTSRDTDQENSKISEIERDWMAHRITDPVEVTIRLARVHVAARDLPPFIYFPALFPLVFFVFPVIASCYTYFAPPYTFLWGDSVGKFEKRRSVGRFLLVGVLAAAVVGVLVNVISKKIGY